MRKTTKTIFFAFISSCFILLSCNKEEKIEQDIQGKWNVINVIDVNDPVKYQWSFDNTLLYVLSKHLDSLQWDTTDVGDYYIETPTLKRNLISFSGFHGVSINGEYKILTFNEEMLIIIREEEGLWKYVEMTAVE